MKKLYIKALAALLIGGTAVSCGDDFLDAKIYEGVDMDSALNSVDNIGYAVNGVYDRLYSYYFAGNYATSFGDIASDLAYWNTQTNHFTDINQFAPTTTDTYLRYIWNYGYKVCDNSARIIKAGTPMLETVTEDEKPYLEMYLAEAHALRAYGHFVLVNIFGHQVKVNGTDFSNTPGVVIIDTPKSSNEMVSRSTVGETYTAIVNDLNESIRLFQSCGMDQGSKTYFSEAAAWGLLSRVKLYLEEYQASADAADKALQLAGISTLTYSNASYKALYNGEGSNTESLFYLAITPIQNWSANSCGSLWSSYSYSPSPYLQSIMASNDCRRAAWTWASNNTPNEPWFNGGKFGAFASGNPANATNYLINAPEMFLNKAESLAKLGNAGAADALLVVAKRNPAIATTADLPSTNQAILDFIKEERARELFQEGFRLYDLRRWDVSANLYATGAPAIDWYYKNFKVSDCVYPIPAAEINAKKGVTQNEGWFNTFPSM